MPLFTFSQASICPPRSTVFSISICSTEWITGVSSYFSSRAMSFA